jgi:chromate transporter
MKDSELFLRAQNRRYDIRGGYAMLPYLRDIVETTRATDEELRLFAGGNVRRTLSPSKPRVHEAVKKGLGRESQRWGIVFERSSHLPASAITNFADLASVKNAFAGIRVGVCESFKAVCKLFKSAV